VGLGVVGKAQPYNHIDGPCVKPVMQECLAIPGFNGSDGVGFNRVRNHHGCVWGGRCLNAAWILSCGGVSGMGAFL